MNNSSPVVEGLLMIHRIISKGLNNSIWKCDAYMANHGIPRDEKEGFVMYVTTLKWVTHSHHTTEDELGFPYFMDHIDAPYDRLKQDHLTMAQVLEKLDKNLTDIASGSLVALRDTLGEFRDLWGPHIKIEEENFSFDRINRIFDQKEQKKLAKMFSEHSSKNSGPGPLALPFMLNNLEKADREAFMTEIPWVVTKILMPVVWKKKWEPMEPFFL
jgi:hemerythrin-like domain-containing protein